MTDSSIKYIVKNRRDVIKYVRCGSCVCHLWVTNENCVNIFIFTFINQL